MPNNEIKLAHGEWYVSYDARGAYLYRNKPDHDTMCIGIYKGGIFTNGAYRSEPSGKGKFTNLQLEEFDTKQGEGWMEFRRCRTFWNKILNNPTDDVGNMMRASDIAEDCKRISQLQKKLEKEFDEGMKKRDEERKERDEERKKRDEERRERKEMLKEINDGINEARMDEKRAGKVPNSLEPNTMSQLNKLENKVYNSLESKTLLQLNAKRVNSGFQI